MHCQLERPLRIISHHIFIAEFEAISEDINQKFGSDAQDSPKKAHRLAKATRKLQICGLFCIRATKCSERPKAHPNWRDSSQKNLQIQAKQKPF